MNPERPTGGIVAAALSDAGCVRASNQDACQIVQPGHPDERRARGVLAIVADGMGGHAGGEIASALAVDVIQREYYGGRGAPGQVLDAAVCSANRAILERAQADPSLQGMGTTCVAMVCLDRLAYASHVGDSRIYLIRRGAIYQMTNDDSAVGGMVREGLISRADARRHEERNVLLKALGTQAATKPSSWPDPLPLVDGDIFLLCTDGLTDLVDDDEILATVDATPVADAPRALVALARARGGFDNITVAMIGLAPMSDGSRPSSLPDTRESEVTR